MTYSLRREKGHVIDQDDGWWESPEEWLWLDVMGGCSCGKSDFFQEQAAVVLEFFATPHEERDVSLLEDPTRELMAHWFDHKELIEHGNSIYGSWLSGKGEEVWKAFQNVKEKT